MGEIADRMEKEILKEFRKWVMHDCKDTLRYMCPVQTGKLRDSVKASQVGPSQYIVGVTAKYGKWVDEGRGPVRPKKAKALYSKERHFGPTSYAGPSEPVHFIRDTVAYLGAE